ncbi:MAG: hypothetical protein WCS52_15125 [bacterium]
MAGGGNKSIHYWVKVPQNNRYTWASNKFIIKEQLCAYLDGAGVSPKTFDQIVFNNYSQWVRLPYMCRKSVENVVPVFAKTEIIYLNQSPSINLINTGSHKAIQETYTPIQEKQYKKAVNTNDSTVSVLEWNFLECMRFIDEVTARGLIRGQRLILHTCLLTCRRIFGASDEQLVKKFAEIVSHEKSQIGLKNDDAIKDFKNHIAKSSIKGNARLPDTRSLTFPLNTPERLVSHLRSRGYCRPKQTAKVILQVILPLLVTLPEQCMNGTAGIKSSEVGKVAGSRYRNDVMTDLRRYYILEARNTKYIPKVKTMTYFINVHKIVYMLFKDHPELLVWKYTANSKKEGICVPEGK